MSQTVQEITAEVTGHHATVLTLVEEIGRVIVGQRDLIEKLLIGLLADGHILVEGVPGLAKTTAIKTLAQAIAGQFSRVQFTPDLLPADVIGTQIYSPRDGTFSVKHGPIHANLVLADEINRAPAKVQSALLEAMQERQVTIGERSFPLPQPFLVMATQNPVEQEGTYPLPEAQVDRFMLKVVVTYPSIQEEISIMHRMGRRNPTSVRPVIDLVAIQKAREVVDKIFVDDKLFEYVANLVAATRAPELFGLKDLRRMIEYGASPRASIYLIQASKAYAFLQGRGYVTPQDIKTIGMDVMRHRLMISYEAEARDLKSDNILLTIFDKVDVP